MWLLFWIIWYALAMAEPVPIIAEWEDSNDLWNLGYHDLIGFGGDNELFPLGYDDYVPFKEWKPQNYTSPDLRKLAVAKVLEDGKTVQEAADDCKISRKRDEKEKQVMYYPKKKQKKWKIQNMKDHINEQNLILYVVL